MATDVARIARTGAMALLLSGGCAHRGGDDARLADMTHTVETLRTQNATYQKQIEELENRVFILTDQLDSKKVNAERVATPELPRVTLKPADREPPAADEPSRSNTQEPDVEYTGEAAKVDARRPVLRLNGGETPVLSVRDPAHEREDSRPLLVEGETARRERAPAPRPTPAPRPAPAPNALELYRRSLEALRGGRHDDAVAGFREFLQRFAGHEFADNAQYWLGECFYDRKDYGAAAREFHRVVERYPQGNKVPDAMLKLGFSYYAAGSCDPGRQALEQLVHAYPKHEAATLATARLAEPSCAAASAASRAAPSSSVSAPSKTGVASQRPAQEVP
jgi:tol-pal system protein YbgF